MKPTEKKLKADIIRLAKIYTQLFILKKKPKKKWQVKILTPINSEQYFAVVKCNGNNVMMGPYSETRIKALEELYEQTYTALGFAKKDAVRRLKLLETVI